MINRNLPPVYVSAPSIPPLEELIPSLEKIWKNKILTNAGEFHKLFEQELSNYLKVKHISLFNNGTIALLTSLKALNINGEVITTPYSFVATSNSIIWNNNIPVFIDIDEEHLNLDPKKIEAAITERTSAILAVHAYGYPCNFKAIEIIANKYGLKVIYDAAHAFGVFDENMSSILCQGDVSILSFHATKVFNTFEGGAIICRDADVKYRIDQLRNFGFIDELDINEIGINGKMNEFSSALGLLQLKQIDNYIEKRKWVDGQYRKKLKDIKGIRCHTEANGFKANYSYFPVFIEKEYPKTRDELYQILKESNIYVRRYFYPLINNFTPYKKLLKNKNLIFPIAENASSKVICLPINADLTVTDIDRIVETFKMV